MPPDPRERYRLLEQLFYRALDCAPEERSARLDEWCGSDESLRREVESLIAASEKAEQAGAPAAPPVRATAGADTWVGRTFGSYRIERLIGRGGMGSVYLARRVEGDFEQTVAIKRVGTRFTTAWLRQRFLLERQTLAALNHPLIARLIDGGVTDDGEPYLVMEYIEGRRLDRYCRETQAPVREIVRLCLDLCDAVSFVHRNLVIHRDLKPGNVLVTAEGQIKLLDFGAAKLLDPAAPMASDATRLGVRAFTPQYASPEQIAGDTVSAASDVFSLGVMLYELLTGQLPFDRQDRTGAVASDSLRETAPVTPHQAVTPVAAGSDEIPAADVGVRRSEIRGDLDAIVLKALRADPRERYPSAEELAADLRNYLANRPVAARQASVAYRAEKMLRRHALGIVASFAIAITLAAGVAATRRESRIAAAEAARAGSGFRQVHHLANLLLFDFYDQVKQLEGSTDVQRRLVSEALGYLDGLSKQASADPDIQLDLVEAYTKMGNVLGNPYEENLGDSPRALATLEKGLALATQVEQKVRRGPLEEVALRRLALVRRSIAEVHFATGDTARAIEYSRSAAQVFETLAARPDVTVTSVQEGGSTYDTLGDFYGLHDAASMGDAAAALAAYRKAVVFNHRVLSMAPGNLRAIRGGAVELMKIANVTGDTDPDAAVAQCEQGIAILDALPADQRMEASVVRVAGAIRRILGRLYSETGRFSEAMPYLIEARDRNINRSSRDPQDTRARFDWVTADSDIAQVQVALDDKTGALATYRQMLDLLDGLLRRDPKNLVWIGHRADTLCRMGAAEKALGLPQAAASLREGTALAVRVAENPAASPDDLVRASDNLLESDPGRAVDFAARAVERTGGVNAAFLIALAKAQRAAGQTAARDTVGKALALLPPPSPGHRPSQLRHVAEQVAGSVK